MNIINKKTLSNIIHNDLGITKDELKSIILDEFRKTVRGTCLRELNKMDPKSSIPHYLNVEIKNILNEWSFRDRVLDTITRSIRDHLEVKIKNPEV